MTLTKLYQLAEQQEIRIDAFKLDSIKSLALSLGNNSYGIAINPLKLASEQDEKMCLAHELGHCTTGSFYSEYTPWDIRSRHEERADRWAIKQLVPQVELNHALHNGHTKIWELAEYFDVPEGFIIKTISYYKICA